MIDFIAKFNPRKASFENIHIESRLLKKYIILTIDWI